MHDRISLSRLTAQYSRPSLCHRLPHFICTGILVPNPPASYMHSIPPLVLLPACRVQLCSVLAGMSVRTPAPLNTIYGKPG